MKVYTWWTLPALLVLLASFVGCGLAPTLSQPQELAATPEMPTPSLELPPADEVALAYLQAWEQADFPAMYSLLTPAAQERYPEDRFLSFYEQVTDEAMLVGVKPQIRASFQPDIRAQVAFDVLFETALVGSFDVQNQMDLSFVQGRWGVDWSPSLIHPELRDDTRVSLVKLAPSRGNIYDREGLGLAVQGQQVEVGVVPGRIQDEESMLALLATVMDEDPEEIRARYAAAAPNWYVPLGRVSAETGRIHYESLISTPGIELREAWARTYHPELVAPHVVGIVGPIPREEVDAWRAQGYAGDETVGWMGLERWAEPYLAGERGGRLEIVRDQGGTVAVLAEKPPRESSSVYTTFDRDFQIKVQDVLGERQGAIVAVEVDTGRVLALATYPTFDPNLFTLGVSEQQWQNLKDDPRGPLLNRSTQGTYPPGSVFKIATMAAGMEAGNLDADSSFLCEGVWMGLGPDLPRVCWLRSGHGNISLAQALTVSCDITFYQVGLLLNELDLDVLPDYARRFGLGSPTDVQVEEEAGFVPDPTWKIQVKGEGWAPGDTVNLAIGQGELLVTPLQIAIMLAAVGNGGTLYSPSVVEMVSSDPSRPEWVFEPRAVGLLPVSTENLAVIRSSLREAALAPDGTTDAAFDGMAFSVAGKTGTAESGREEPHAWFAGYTPAQSPEIAVAVVLEHGGTGGEAAAPLFRQVVESYFAGENQP